MDANLQPYYTLATLLVTTGEPVALATAALPGTFSVGAHVFTVSVGKGAFINVCIHTITTTTTNKTTTTTKASASATAFARATTKY